MKLKKNLINTLEEMALLALFRCINKLHRLKGEPVEEIIDSDGIILNDDQAEAALQFELSKIDAFQKKVNEGYEEKTN